ncbi:hypothetical protein WA026_017595, partial [Henosepilachna vigintioctopunctata]
MSHIVLIFFIFRKLYLSEVPVPAADLGQVFNAAPTSRRVGPQCDVRVRYVPHRATAQTSTPVPVCCRPSFANDQ